MKLLLPLLLCFSLNAHGKGVFPGTLALKDAKLVKNGEGVRVFGAFIGFVDIYTAALFLKKKESDGKKILESADPKVLKMYYHYDVPKHKIVNAWQDSFKKQCGKCKDTKVEMDKFLAAEKDCAKQTQRTLEFFKGTVTIHHNKKKMFESKIRSSPK